MRPRTWMATALGAALLLTACGSDDDGGGGSAADPGVTLPAPAEGDPPDLPVAEASQASPLPEVAVRQVNGDGGWVQFRNEIPSEQPLLVWFWAPH